MPSALDRLLGQALESMIREKLGQKTCEKIEARLRERYSLDLTASINDFIHWMRHLGSFSLLGRMPLRRILLIN
jgi:hypothetical protein